MRRGPYRARPIRVHATVRQETARHDELQRIREDVRDKLDTYYAADLHRAAARMEEHE
jgi:hypothetical protein